MHIGRVELCNNNGVGPGRVGNAQPKDTVFKAGSGVNGRKPVKALVSLLVGIAISPVNNLLSWNGLFPNKGKVTAR